MSGIRRKIDLYILSLGLLFVFFFIITAKAPSLPFDIKNLDAWRGLIASNLLPTISLLVVTYCWYAYRQFSYDLEGATEIPFEITTIEDINYEHLTFLATYVVPLISFDFGSIRQIVVLALLLIVMGVIYIKTDLFYANPSLALLGFRIYRASGNFKNNENRSGIILISRSKLSEGKKVSYIRLDDRIYYVQEAIQ